MGLCVPVSYLLLKPHVLQSDMLWSAPSVAEPTIQDASHLVPTLCRDPNEAETGPQAQMVRATDRARGRKIECKSLSTLRCVVNDRNPVSWDKFIEGYL